MAKAKKARTHTFKITVVMDRACTASHALREVNDTIHGTFYTTQIEDSDPGYFVVRPFRRLPARRAPMARR